MPELPELLRQTFAAAQNETQTHPDADTITAFVEQSLPAAERQSVVAHLSVCQPCREVVSLSQPLLPELETQTVLQPVPVSRWRRLLTPSFGIAASIAAMAVIAVLVLQLPEKNTAPSAQNAKEAQGSPEAKSATEAKAAPPTNETAPATSSSDANKSASAQPVETRSAIAAAAAPSLADRVALSKELQVRGRRDEPADMKTLAGLSVSSSAPVAKAPVFTASLKKDYVNTNFFAANGNEGVGVDGQADKD
ncbi:MAG TPA: hypothetical protein VH724_14095, partial [Candidatus Angelobacter sp.]|nr:hypothetical protein [Candidatus Angelobacter sp.]